MNEHNDLQSELSPADQRLLDALIEAGFDRTKVPAVLGAAGGVLTADDDNRLSVVARMFSCLDEYPVEDAEPALMHATLARIDRHEEQLSQRLRFDVAVEEQSSRRGFRIRIPDLVTVAAIMLIAVGVLWPVLGSVRQQAIQTACANNLKTVGYGFSQYSNDNNGSLPVAMAGPTGTWESFRNAMNLSPVVTGGYCDAGHLNCPGHAHNHGSVASGETEPSYSYRWFTPKGLIHWNTGRITVVLGDLNPLVDAARNGWEAPPLSVSVNHRGRGQNVLASDGRTMWLEQPLIGATNSRADNIWMPDNMQSLKPGVSPADDSDVFLVH